MKQSRNHIKTLYVQICNMMSNMYKWWICKYQMINSCSSKHFHVWKCDTSSLGIVNRLKQKKTHVCNKAILSPASNGLKGTTFLYMCFIGFSHPAMHPKEQTDTNWTNNKNIEYIQNRMKSNNSRCKSTSSSNQNQLILSDVSTDVCGLFLYCFWPCLTCFN